MNRLEAQSLLNSLQAVFSGFSRACLMTSELQTLHLKYQSLADIGTLPQCCEVTHKYLRLLDGDIVVTNDPFSGGTLLSCPTLILGVGTKALKGAVPAELLVASRLSLPRSAGVFKTVDAEGLRIPPSPFFIKGEINTAIVEALKSHPQTPPGFIDELIKEAQRLLALRSRLKIEMQAGGRFDFNKTRVRQYLEATEQGFNRQLDDVGEGTSTAELQISPTQTLRLRIEHHENQFNFDFAGTTAGDGLFLTDSAVIGAVIGVTISLLGLDIPINSGLFKRFDVKAQRGSLVNSAFPSSVALGHTDGLNLVANLVMTCLGAIHKKHAWASSGTSYCAYQIRFQDGRVLSDSLPCGSGASERGVGLNGISLWKRSSPPPSIELMESTYPVQILGSGFRSQSSGEGRYNGGAGVVRSLRVTEDADLSWNFASPPHKPEGIQGGKSAMGAEMILQHVDGETEDLASSGAMKIKKGETLTIMSPGGGGYGLKSP